MLMMTSTGAAITGDCIERHVEGDRGELTEVAFELTARFRAKACRSRAAPGAQQNAICCGWVR
ncbi:hypothetical protein V1290_006605 [Bradyrhizobium sp. AZCC 1578]